MVMLTPILVEATTPATPPAGTAIQFTVSNPFRCGSASCNLMSLITAILNNIVMPIAGVGVVVFIIYAGFSFVMAQGKPAEIQKAQQMLLWGLIGAGILLGAAGISRVLENTIRQLVV